MVGGARARRGRARGARRFLRVLLKTVGLAVAIVVAVPVVYILLALGLGAMPRGGPVAAVAETAVVAYVCRGVAHTDIVLPVRSPGVDWEAVFPHAAPLFAGPGVWIAIGWGDLAFYQETPSWADLRFSTALHALLGSGPSALHVVYVGDPSGIADCATVPLTRAQHDALARHILAAVDPDAAGAPRLAAPAGLGTYEAFYAARGRYSPWRTCNEWTSEALAAAGVPTGLWTPFPFLVMWHLR